MSIHLITDTRPACYGFGGCPHHHACRRYTLIEQAPEVDRIGTCDDRAEGEYPLLVQRQPAEHE